MRSQPPVLQLHTQTCVAEPLICELDVRRSLDGSDPHKDAGPDGLFHKVLKALNSHISPVLAQLFNQSLQTAQAPADWRHTIVTPVANTPHNRPKAIQAHQPHVYRLQYPRDDPQRKAPVSLIPTFPTDNCATWLPFPSFDCNTPSVC